MLVRGKCAKRRHTPYRQISSPEKFEEDEWIFPHLLLRASTKQAGARGLQKKAVREKVMEREVQFKVKRFDATHCEHTRA